MTPPAMPAFPGDVDVAIVSHNGRDTLPRVLDCLAATGAPRDRIVVYDVGSTDETGAWLAANWPGVETRRLDGNVGPNPARNLALRSATRPWLLLVDADAYLRADAPALLRAAVEEQPNVGLAAPVVVHARDPRSIQYAGVRLHFMCEAVSPWIDRPLIERGDERREIGSAAGVALLLNVAIGRAIGLWDERYFMGKDDGDFCFRLRLAGYRLVEEPRAIVEHGSRPRSAWMFPFQIRNRWDFMLKNYETRTLVVLLPALCLHEALQLAMLTVKGHLGAWRRAARELRGWLPELGARRKRVQATRVARDRDLLVSAPLLVRADVVGSGVGRALKTIYDAWLAAYWGLARHLLS